MQTIRSSLRGFAKMIIKHPVSRKIKSFSKTAFNDKYLFYTNVTISISLSATGDYLEQKYEIYMEEIEAWKKLRTLHMAFSGMTVGVICHHWYKVLDKRMPGRTLNTVIKKLLLDQLLFSPVVITLFFASVALFEDVTMDEFKKELKHKFWRLYAAEWVVWPPAQIINFYLLPTKYRVLYDNVISLGYDIFTSHVKHSKIEDDEETVEESKQERPAVSLEPESKTINVSSNNNNNQVAVL